MFPLTEYLLQPQGFSVNAAAFLCRSVFGAAGARERAMKEIKFHPIAYPNSADDPRPTPCFLQGSRTGEAGSSESHTVDTYAVPQSARGRNDHRGPPAERFFGKLAAISSLEGVYITRAQLEVLARQGFPRFGGRFIYGHCVAEF
jgi:hypothetical protein